MLSWLKLNRPRPAAAPTHAAEAAVASLPAPAADTSTPLQLYRGGRHEAASQAALALLQADAQAPEARLVQALLALDAGRHLEALRQIEALQALMPGSADAALALGRALTALGRKPAAAAALQQAQALDPARGEAAMHLGLLALSGGRGDEALQHLQAAVRTEPHLGEAHGHLGDLLRERNRPDDAERHYRQAVAARPDLASVLANLGALLKDRQRPTEAAVFLAQALALRPGLAPALFNLGMVHIQQRRWADAAAQFRRYGQAAPKDADAPYWLGNALMGTGDAAGARKAYQAAVRLSDGHLQARWGLAMAQLPALPQTEAEQAAGPKAFEREVMQLKTWYRSHPGAEGFLAVGAQQPYYLAYVPRNHRAVLGSYGSLCTTLMAGWARKVGVPAPAPAAPAGRRKVGIVSGHIHGHSVWHALLRGWVEHLPAAQFDLQIFYTGTVRDAETEWALRKVTRLHQGAGDWRAWAKTLSDARCDVLIYPEVGMDATTLRLASLRLARVQLGSWGHPLSTGLPTMDGYLSAQAFEPADEAAHYTERLLALPRLGCCYRPYQTPPVRPDLSAHGIAAGDRLLLCAGTPFKYAPAEDTLWAEVARRCSPCKLVFFRQAEGTMAELLAQRLRTAFEAAGVSFDDTVRFVPWQTQAAFFGLLDRADAYLDTVGFSGFNTAMQAIERGTPVVAWEGAFLRGRFASGILQQIGLDEWVADTHAGYAERAERLCADAALRQRVRSQIAAQRSSLYDDRPSVAALAAQLQAL